MDEDAPHVLDYLESQLSADSEMGAPLTRDSYATTEMRRGLMRT